jgi:hypothetical protein
MPESGMANFLTRMFSKAGAPGAAPAAPKGAKPVASGGKAGGGSMLPPLEPIKAPPGGGAAYPGYRKSIVAQPDTKIQRKAFDVTNVDLLTTYRNGASTAENVRVFARFSPEMSASVAATNALGIPEKYTTIARNPDGSFNLDGTKLAMQILRQMNAMADYQDGFSHVSSLRSVCEALGKSMQEEGAMMLELVLDKQRLPLSMQPIAIGTVDLYDDDKGLSPKQKVGGEEIDLDLPSVFYVAINPDLYDAYARSPMEAAIQPVLAATGFLNDLRRLCQRHVYQRYDIVLLEEKIKERMPSDVMQDPELIPAYLNGLIDEVGRAINNLGIDEALIHYDFFEIKYVEGDSGNIPDTFNTVNDITGGKLATAMKTPASVLGLGASSSTAASTDTLLYMINANAMIRNPLQTILSKLMTLAVRLFGLDVTVEFEFDDIELRPKSELEAYLAMKQSRLLTQLSFGFITDEEFCLKMTGQLPPPGHQPLMGTLFPVVPAQPAADNGNNTSTTGTMGKDKSAPEAAPGSKKGQAK